MAVADDGPELELEPHPMAGTVELCGVAAAAVVDDDDEDEEVCGVDEGPPSRESPPPDLSIVLLLNKLAELHKRTQALVWKISQLNFLILSPMAAVCSPHSITFFLLN